MKSLSDRYQVTNLSPRGAYVQSFGADPGNPVDTSYDGVGGSFGDPKETTVINEAPIDTPFFQSGGIFDSYSDNDETFPLPALANNSQPLLGPVGNVESPAPASTSPSLLSTVTDLIFNPYQAGFNMIAGVSPSKTTDPLGINSAANTVASGISSSIKTGTTLLLLAGIAYIFLAHPPSQFRKRQ